MDGGGVSDAQIVEALKDIPTISLAIEQEDFSSPATGIFSNAGNRGRVFTCARRFAEAEQACRQGLAIDPAQLLAQVELTYAMLFDGRFEEAIAVGRRAVETHGPVNAPRQALALSYALAGRRDEAFELVSETAEPGAGYRSQLALGLGQEAASLLLVVSFDHDLGGAETVEGEGVGLAQGLAANPGFDAVCSQKGTDLLLFKLTLGSENNNAFVLRHGIPFVSGHPKTARPSRRVTQVSVWLLQAACRDSAG